MEPWQETQERAKAKYRSGDLVEARRLFLQSVQEAEHYPESDDRLHSALTVAALFFLVTESLEEAEVYFRRGLETLEAQLGPGQEVATYMLSLADVLQRLGRGEEAQEIKQSSQSMWPSEAN